MDRAPGRKDEDDKSNGSSLGQDGTNDPQLEQLADGEEPKRNGGSLREPKKKDGDMSIELTRTQDILKHLGSIKKPGQVICGFSMETENMLENSAAKLEKKNVDMIVANNVKVKGAGFGVDTNVITMITPGKEIALEMMSKDEAAEQILDEVLRQRMR